MTTRVEKAAGGTPEAPDAPDRKPPPGTTPQDGPAAVVELEVSAPRAWPLPRRQLNAVIGRAVAAALAVAAADGAVVEREGVPPRIEILLADDAEIRCLNARWRGQDRPTNVLSFPAAEAPFVPDVPWPLGSLALAGGVMRREAATRGVDLSEHLSWLVIHGILHLLGYDHERDAVEAEHMEALERAALARLGLPDPYAEPRE